MSSGLPTRSDTNQAVQQKKMARGWKFRIWEVEGLYSLWKETKALISCVITTQLICAFVFCICKKQVIICFPMDYRDLSVKSKVIISLFQTVRLSLSIFTVCKFVFSPIKYN